MRLKLFFIFFQQKLQEQKDEDESCSNSALSSSENKENNLCSDAQAKPLKNLLCKYNIGKTILSYYETEKNLEQYFRNKLCDIIVTDMENRDEKYVLYYFNLYFIMLYTFDFIKVIYFYNALSHVYTD